MEVRAILPVHRDRELDSLVDHAFQESRAERQAIPLSGNQLQGLRATNLSASDWQVSDPVDPLLGLRCRPNGYESFDHIANRETLWDDDVSRTRRRPNELHENALASLSGHV